MRYTVFIITLYAVLLQPTALAQQSPHNMERVQTDMAVAQNPFILAQAPVGPQPLTSGVYHEMTVRELYAIMNERERANGQRFDAQERAVSAALAAAKEAVTKAEVASEKRFDSVNEFRNTLKDQQVNFATIAYVDIRFRALETSLERIATRHTELSAKIELIQWLWGATIAVIGLMIAGVVAFRKKTP